MGKIVKCDVKRFSEWKGRLRSVKSHKWRIPHPAFWHEKGIGVYLTIQCFLGLLSCVFRGGLCLFWICYSTVISPNFKNRTTALLFHHSIYFHGKEGIWMVWKLRNNASTLEDNKTHTHTHTHTYMCVCIYIYIYIYTHSILDTSLLVTRGN